MVRLARFARPDLPFAIQYTDSIISKAPRQETRRVARGRVRSEASSGDRVVVPESETNFGGTGKVASFQFS